jgi:hypothetical protein
MDLKKLISGGRHTAVIKLPFEDADGKVVNEDLLVVYRGVSLREGRAIQERVEAEADERKSLVAALLEVVIELPGVMEDGHPVKLTPEFFEAMDTFYLNRINAGIHEDRQGPNR